MKRKKQARQSERRVARKEQSTTCDKDESNKACLDVVAQPEETETGLVSIQWKGFEERQFHSAMFHCAEKSPETIQFDVAGAPCPLRLQRDILRQVHCGLFDCYLLSTASTIPISKETLKQLYGELPGSWKIVWSYLGLLYGLCVLDACIRDSLTWIQTRCGLPLSRFVHVIILCDYLQDKSTLKLLGQSLNQFSELNRFVRLRHGDTDSDDIDSDDILNRDLARVLFSQYRCFDLSNDSPLFTALYREAISLNIEELAASSFIICFLRDILSSRTTDLTSENMFILTTLVKCECQYVEGEFEACDESGQDALRKCFIPVSTTVWSKLEKYELVHRLRHGRRHRLRHRLSTGLDWLKMYWTLVFPTLSSELQNRLFVSGSLVPMCLLTFQTTNFKKRVTHFFPESDMDVYVYGEDGKAVVEKVRSYLGKQHLHVYEESCTEFHGGTAITLVMPFHPLFNNQSLRVQLIYYHTTVTPAQVAGYHHLCPVRAYYLPSTHEVVAAPSALLCWITGSMSFYRLKRSDDSVNLLSVLKYLTRSFKVLRKSKFEVRTSGISVNSVNTATERVSAATRHIFDLFEKVYADPAKRSRKGLINLLQALYPKHHLCQNDQSLCMTKEGIQLIKDLVKNQTEFY